MATFNKLHTALAESYQSIILDLPGFGDSQSPRQVWILDDYAMFIRAFLAKLGIEKPYAVIGHSNGGALAIRGLATGSLQAEKLVLLAASGIRPKKHIKHWVLKAIAKVGKTFTFWLPFERRQALRKKLYGVAGSDMLVAPHLQETFKRTVRQDVQADARRLTMPTLLIYGSNDTATPTQDGERFAQLIPHARLEVIPDAEHFVHVDQPDVVISKVKEFLK